MKERTPIDITLLNYRKNGEAFYNHLILTPVTSENEVTHYIGFQQDVTVQEQTTIYLETAKQHAEESVKMKANFLASMSHEIRTPIHGISGILQLLMKTDLNDKQTEYLRLAQNSTGNLLHIVNDILDFSKIEAGQLHIERVAFDLKAELEKVTAEYELLCNTKGLTFETSFTLDGQHIVTGDVVRIRQVLLNLLSNAVKFTSNGTIQLDVSLENTATQCQLIARVKDTGIGIEGDKLDTIFEQFTQANMSTTREFGGTGLGLSISKQLCQLMGGDISVRSQKGHGCEFTFKLPVQCEAPDNASPPGQADNESITTADADIRILVVEDNEINRLIATQHLSDYKLLCAKNGAEAVSILKQSKLVFDVILMDCLMPVMDGFEATRIIRAGEAGARNTNVPIIALTANAMKGDREACFAAGMNDYLSKPFDVGDLHAKVIRWSQRADNGAAADLPH